MYFCLPFEMPENIERIDIRYAYARYTTTSEEQSEKTQETSIIDLAVCAPNDDYLGSSGSNRSHIYISEYSSSDGYAKRALKGGTWNIIVGAYKIQDEGLTVRYELAFTEKKLQLLKGDLHMHTTGSDGNLSIDEIIHTAKKTGLDFVCITDHNNYAHNYSIPNTNDITVIPGVEWTHYKGHANMLGNEKAYEGNYYTNTVEETEKKLLEAHKNGSFVSLNHPFCPNCGWKWGFENVYYDALEIVNGPMFAKLNIEALQHWHERLCNGERIVAVGGSDFHKNEAFRNIGTPTTCVYSMSKGRSDIIDALKRGHAYITFQTSAPSIEITSNDKIMGDNTQPGPVHFKIDNIGKSDIIRIISKKGIVKEISQDVSRYTFSLDGNKDDVFYRVEIHREFDLTTFPIAISNPIYIG